MATSIATLKENIIAEWPTEKEDWPHTVKDIKLISAGRVLENSRSVGECRSQLYDIPGGVTMHVVVQTHETKPQTDPKQSKCACVIL
ncbi:membrane-anchored ubiquitin-fold protein 2-like [Salvia splendens]|uniref:membrane-anchored ubiquitin-fold protein 2-like n=1 Tax=Salvia splendens TaxID=180675 RepID=UPI001C260684|nr:membrane-anchored ubiquitin-fold protein 2-like [Salvia splendens]